MNFDENLWKILEKHKEFVIIKVKRRFGLNSNKDLLRLLQDMKESGWKSNLHNYQWDGSILFEKITKTVV